MKKIILSLALLIFIEQSFSQTPALSTDYYLKKSKTQKTIAWIMLGGGIAMTTTGLLIANKKESDLLTSFSDKGLGVTLEVAGIASALGSILFFTSSAKNAHKAAAISFNYQRILFQQQKIFVVKAQPALTLKITL